jgi:hypothetical protein
LLGDSAVKVLTGIEVRLLELGVGAERETSPLDEAEEAWVVLVTSRIEGLREQVLAEAVRQLLLVWQIAVAGVEALRQKQQVADAVAVFGELCWCPNSSSCRSA